jgi:hypothetical protein
MNERERDLVEKMKSTANWNYVAVDRTTGTVYQRNWRWEYGEGNLYEPMGELSLDAVAEIDDEIHSPNLFFRANFGRSENCGREGLHGLN